MRGFEEIGQAMILAQEGREQLARLVAGYVRGLGQKFVLALRKAPSEIEIDRPSRSF